MLVGNLWDALVAPDGIWSSGSHQVCENELERELDLVVGGLGMRQLVILAHGALVALWQRPVEAHPIVIEVIQKV